MKKILILTSLVLSLSATAADELSGRQLYCETGDPSGAGPTATILVDSVSGSHPRSEISLTIGNTTSHHLAPRTVTQVEDSEGRLVSRSTYRLNRFRTIHLLVDPSDSKWVTLQLVIARRVFELSCQ